MPVAVDFGNFKFLILLLGCSNRCRDIVIFKLLGCRPPPSWIFLDLCNGPNSHEGRTASPCQISSQSVKPRPRYGYFSSIFIRISDFFGGFTAVKIRRWIRLARSRWHTVQHNVWLYSCCSMAFTYRSVVISIVHR